MSQFSEHFQAYDFDASARIMQHCISETLRVRKCSDPLSLYTTMATVSEGVYWSFGFYEMTTSDCIERTAAIQADSDPGRPLY